jgi:hypothetical protein
MFLNNLIYAEATEVLTYTLPGALWDNHTSVRLTCKSLGDMVLTE